MNIKKVVKKYWKDFEIIAFNAVKNELPQEFISKEIITQSIKDGGYDGEIILLSPNGDIEQILLEAKLRSNVSADLPLQGFAKALIVAIIKQADMIYIVTNLHFSDNTIALLEKYSEKANLDIELLNGKSIKEFIKNNDNLLDEVSINLKNFLNDYTESAKEQHLRQKTIQNLKFCDNSSEYSKIINILTKHNGIQIVTGCYGSGKTHYIEKLSEVLKVHGNNFQTIDLSMHATYRSFFLELLEKSFGLSLELFDKAGADVFDSALQKIIDTDTKDDDITMIKHIYSKIDSLPYDYSVIFKLMVKFYQKIYNIKINKAPLIIAFENLVYAPKEVLQLLQYLLNSNIKIPCIIELTEDDYCSSIKPDEWNALKHNIIGMSKHKPKFIKSWGETQAKNYLQKNICELDDKEIVELIKKFGTTPIELSKLITYINNENLCNSYPCELLYNNIKKIDLSDNQNIYNKCFDYMIYTNSDILYVFAFLYFLNGQVNEELLSSYFGNPSRQIKCLLIMKKSNLFIIKQDIQLKSHIIKKSFDKYCKSNFTEFIVNPVINFLEGNMENVHLSQEMKLELEAKKRFFYSEYDYVISLINLGKEYLKLYNLNLANDKFSEALEIMENSLSIIDLPTIQELQLYLGLIETEIWKIGKKGKETEEQLSHIETIIEKAILYSLDYQLLVLRYYILKYQFYHTQGKNIEAFSAAKKGVDWIKNYDLYSDDLESCGKIWRFYAIATKEISNNIYKCLDIFKEGSKYCKGSVKFLFGQIIHNNMIVESKHNDERLKCKLNNYKPLLENDSRLSIDEYLHYRVNVAALRFMQKDYVNAENEYKELLKKSDIFNITREKMRILNDMANICWINKNYSEARIKYYNAKSIAELSGCTRNHWPILVNLVSFEIFNDNYFDALKLHNELFPLLLKQCQNLIQDQIGFEKMNYCRAAFIIHLKNILKIYKSLNGKNKKQLFIDMKVLLTKSNLLICQENDTVEKIEKTICKLTLKNSEYDHNGLFLIKD